MKSKIFMYLFFFAILLVLFQYMNEKSIYESQENKINLLTTKVTKAKDSIAYLSDKIAELNYFTLQGNENAMTYLENLGMDPGQVEQMVSDAIYERNFDQGGNSLVPMEGMYGKWMVNKVKFLNHRWVLADFSDGKYWGEMVIEYFFDEKNQLDLKVLSSVLYPN
jgi:hypothetical protein